MKSKGHRLEKTDTVVAPQLIECRIRQHTEARRHCSSLTATRQVCCSVGQSCHSTRTTRRLAVLLVMLMLQTLLMLLTLLTLMVMIAAMVLVEK